MNNIFRGLGIALVTPFKQNGEIDYDALERLIEYQIENGADFFTIWQQRAKVLAYRQKRKTNSQKPLSR